ncbi:MAG: IS1634 family transposase [Verrucomicrobia bacterium]|nr:IS1634 family transposase [Verrucomicrobiota bacterium]
MFLRCTKRKKNGKLHRYWSLVENKRCAGDRVVQRHVLYLGEINERQEVVWRDTAAAFPDAVAPPRTTALFADERELETAAAGQAVHVKLAEMALRKPRQYGACWLACHLYQELGLDRFWAERLPPSRKGTRWDLILQTLTAYRLIDPGSEWRLHREWFEHSALGDLLGCDFAALAEAHKLYRCHDRIVAHKPALFSHLAQRWRDLFNVKFDVLLYDLTSTYFESAPPFPASDKRKFGYSRDKRPDCVQVVVALIVTPEGFPLAYEVMAGNTSDKTTLQDFLTKIEQQYGEARRIWVMDRGIPTEEILQQMRQRDPPVYYVVGTPKQRLTQFEQKLAALPWEQAREGVAVKLLAESGELYVYAQSRDRVNKERAMRRRQLKWLRDRLKELERMQPKRDELLMKLGAARHEAPTAWRLFEVKVAAAGRGNKHQPTEEAGPPAGFTWRLRWDKLRAARRQEGRYLLRSFLPQPDQQAPRLWEFYLQLGRVEEAFRNLKGDLSLRPIYHQEMPRIEAHIFIAFLAYCLHVTLACRLRALAPGLTPRSVLEKLAALQMLDVHLPTTDGREVILTRYTQPEPEQRLILEKLKLDLPAQSPPRISAAQTRGA